MSITDISQKNAWRRVEMFKREYDRGIYLLACHAALPVILNPELLHLLRINFFLDIPEPLTYTEESDLLFSPICQPIGDDLYEIDSETRKILLQGLVDEYGHERIRELAGLLWQYTDQCSPWEDHIRLKRAQQLTALNFLKPEKAKEWLTEAEESSDYPDSGLKDWFVAMYRGLREREEAISPKKSELDTGKELHQALIDFLAPLPCMIEGYSSRRAVLYAAGLDTFSKSIDLTGSSHNVTTDIVNRLRQYGTIDGTPALVVFLQAIATQVGQDKQLQIQKFCEQITTPKWDVFICHAWEDKEEIARPLAKALQDAGLQVWYDEFSLEVGDSLRQSIDQGLRGSQYGVVILSPHFFEKQWAQKELNQLAARERGGKKVILPLWHHVDSQNVARFSPELADRLAISTEKGLELIVHRILRKLRKPLSFRQFYKTPPDFELKDRRIDAITSKKWDIFICHAGEDREEIARPLAEALQDAGLQVWYDEFSLEVGDSLRQSINQGLRGSQYGVVILSPSFFAKEWPKKELDGLAAREMTSGKVILPVWHQVTHDDVLNFSPDLAKKKGILTEKGVKDVVQQLLRVFPEKETRKAEKTPRIHLRSEPLRVSEDEFEEVFHLDARRLPREYIQNEYEEQKEMIVDHTTGLMWQKSGSNDALTYALAQEYVMALNQQRFAGYDDWRLPTIPELMSLLEPHKQSNSLYINSLFNEHQLRCWSNDKRSSGSVWRIHFNLGVVYWDFLNIESYVRAVRSMA